MLENKVFGSLELRIPVFVETCGRYALHGDTRTNAQGELVEVQLLRGLRGVLVGFSSVLLRNTSNTLAMRAYAGCFRFGYVIENVDLIVPVLEDVNMPRQGFFQA